LAKLAMSWERKIHVLLMFSLGSLWVHKTPARGTRVNLRINSVTIVSILRLTSLIKFANTQNITCKKI
jgi:hypothetical protein